MQTEVIDWFPNEYDAYYLTNTLIEKHMHHPLCYNDKFRQSKHIVMNEEQHEESQARFNNMKPWIRDKRLDELKLRKLERAFEEIDLFLAENPDIEMHPSTIRAAMRKDPNYSRRNCMDAYFVDRGITPIIKIPEKVGSDGEGRIDGKKLLHEIIFKDNFKELTAIGLAMELHKRGCVYFGRKKVRAFWKLYQIPVTLEEGSESKRRLIKTNPLTAVMGSLVGVNINELKLNELRNIVWKDYKLDIKPEILARILVIVKRETAEYTMDE